MKKEKRDETMEHIKREPITDLLKDKPVTAHFTGEPTVIPAHDDKGHSVKLTVYVPPNFMKELDIIVKTFKYYNKGDVVRDALMRFFKLVQSWEGGIIEGSRLGAIYATIAYINDDKEQQAVGLLLKDVQDRISMYIHRGAVSQARLVAMNTRRGIEQMPDGYWKTEFLRAFDVTFKWLFNEVKGVSLLNLIDEEEEENV